MSTRDAPRKHVRRLVVWTARVSYGGTDRLDITRKSGGEEGAPFAPSALLFERMRSAREEAKALPSEEAQRLLGRAWTLYETDFIAEMRVSFGIHERSWRASEHAAYARGARAHAPAWKKLLARESATLVCFCTDPLRCHRTLVARVLGKLGADVRGEVETDAGPQRKLPF